MLRQIEKEYGDNVRHELDQAYDSLRDLLHASSSNGSNGIPLEQSADPIDGLQTEGVEYDQHVRELAFDKRARPKDRTKTEEELALEEKEALETAERQRRKRMLGLDDNDSNDEAGSRKRRRRGDDDLDDDFDDGEESDWADVGPTLQGADMKSDDAESIDRERASSDSGEDSDDGQEDFEVSSNEEHQDVNSSVQIPKSSAELPYTFPCPSSHQELLSLLQDVEDKDVPIVIQRIRTLHHTSLAPDNKSKLQVCSLVVFAHHFTSISGLLSRPH